MSDTAVSTTNASNALAAFTGGVNPFLQHTKAEGVNSGLYMRHNGNTGKYILGDKEIDGGAFLFDLMSARLAWLGFDPNNKPVNGPEVKMIEGVPLADPPQVPGVKWNKQIKVAVIDIETGKEIVLSCKADRPTRAIWRLIKAFGETVGRHPDGKAFKIPLVEASSRSFEMDIDEPQKDGTSRKIRVKKYSDAYEITDWYTNDAVAEIVALGKEAVEGDDEGNGNAQMIDGGNVREVQVEVIPPAKQTAQTQSPRSRFGQR